MDVNMSKLKPITVEGEKFFFSLSFDIDDFIGDGIWWLQIYDSSYNITYDKPLASSMGYLEIRKVREIIEQEISTYRGALL